MKGECPFLFLFPVFAVEYATMAKVVDTFGSVVERVCDGHPIAARRLMRTGWQAMGLKFRFAPDKRLLPADRYLARMMMKAMLAPLKRPDRTAMVSIFTPCELVQEAGLAPYNVEGFSAYVAATSAEQACIQAAHAAGVPETLCSYHRTFLGAAERGLLPAPRCVVYTNVACDANLITFRTLARHYGVPSFAIDVPREPCPESVRIVERQLHDLRGFLEKATGTRIDDDALARRVQRSRDTLEGFEAYQKLVAHATVPADLVTPLYCAVTNNILLGTIEEERYVSMLLDGALAAHPKQGAHIYWMHTVPYLSQAMRDALYLRDDVRIIGCELASACSSDFDPERPFEAMARRLVYNRFNGGALRRIRLGIESARTVGADAAVWFNHWGCKHTIAASQLAKRMFEEAGIPLLVLDGDGADRMAGSEGQLATRLEAFLEMLG